MTRILALCCALLISSSWSNAQVQDAELLRDPTSDRPKVAVFQYESGRVLVARVVNGELQVIEPTDASLATLAQYLDQSVAVAEQGQPSQRAPANQHELFFSPAWYNPHFIVNTDSNDNREQRAKQNASERAIEVEQRRAKQGTTGLRNKAGRVYPYTARREYEKRRLEAARESSGDSAYVTFFTLGGGLEYYRQQAYAAREELTLLTYDVLLEEGMTYFKNRQYGQAARSFIAAADKDHGDAGSRLYAAQTLMASGLYRQAFKFTQRAIELAPLILNRPLNHRRNYPHPEDFDMHLQALQEYVASHPEDDAAVMLLAFQQFFSDDPKSAMPAMQRVRQLAKKSRFAKKLWNAAAPMLGE